MRKKFWMFIVLTIVIASLAGCGAAKEPQNDQTKNPQGNADGEKVTIKLMQFKVEITDEVQQMVADYTKENPNVIIEAQVTRDYETLLKTRFQSGDEPDIFMTKAFTDITDWSDKLADLSNEPWMDKVSPSAVAGMTVNGKKLGFPVAFEGYGFIYNKDLFAQAGIDKVLLVRS